MLANFILMKQRPVTIHSGMVIARAVINIIARVWIRQLYIKFTCQGVSIVTGIHDQLGKPINFVYQKVDEHISINFLFG